MAVAAKPAATVAGKPGAPGAAKKAGVAAPAKPVPALTKPLTKEPRKGRESASGMDREMIVGDMDDGLQELTGFEVAVDAELSDIDSSIDLKERGDVESRVNRLLEIGKEKG